MSLPVIEFENGLMIITHPTGVVQTITKTELEEIRDVQIEEMDRTGQQIEETNSKISKLSLSLTR